MGRNLDYLCARIAVNEMDLLPRYPRFNKEMWKTDQTVCFHDFKSNLTSTFVYISTTMDKMYNCK